MTVARIEGVPEGVSAQSSQQPESVECPFFSLPIEIKAIKDPIWGYWSIEISAKEYLRMVLSVEVIIPTCEVFGGSKWENSHLSLYFRSEGQWYELRFDLTELQKKSLSGLAHIYYLNDLPTK